MCSILTNLYGKCHCGGMSVQYHYKQVVCASQLVKPVSYIFIAKGILYAVNVQNWNCYSNEHAQL